MDRGVWWATVHGVAKSRARLKQLNKQKRIYITESLCCTPETNIINQLQLKNIFKKSLEEKAALLVLWNVPSLSPSCSCEHPEDKSFLRFCKTCFPSAHLGYCGSHSTPGHWWDRRHRSNAGSGCRPCAAPGWQGTRCSSWCQGPCILCSSRGTFHS